MLMRDMTEFYNIITAVPKYMQIYNAIPNLIISIHVREKKVTWDMGK